MYSKLVYSQLHCFFACASKLQKEEVTEKVVIEKEVEEVEESNLLI